MPVQTRKWSQKFVEDAISAGGRGSTSVALSSSGWVRYFRCSHVMFSKVYSIVMYFAQINKVESGNGKKVVDSCSFNKAVISPTDGNMNDMSSFSCVAFLFCPWSSWSNWGTSVGACVSPELPRWPSLFGHAATWQDVEPPSNDLYGQISLS